MDFNAVVAIQWKENIADINKNSSWDAKINLAAPDLSTHLEIVFSKHLLGCTAPFSAAFQSLCHLELSKTIEVDFQPLFLVLAGKL